MRVLSVAPQPPLAGPGDILALYVTTNGFLWLPYQGAPQPAKLLRLSVGVAGHSLLEG
jgi:hypothetical protein